LLFKDSFPLLLKSIYASPWAYAYIKLYYKVFCSTPSFGNLMVNMSDWFLLNTFYKWSAAYLMAFYTRNYFFSYTFIEFVFVSVIETYGVTVDAEGFSGLTVVTTKVFTICTFLSLLAFLPILPSFK